MKLAEDEMPTPREIFDNLNNWQNRYTDTSTPSFDFSHSADNVTIFRILYVVHWSEHNIGDVNISRSTVGYCRHKKEQKTISG